VSVMTQSPFVEMRLKRLIRLRFQTLALEPRGTDPI